VGKQVDQLISMLQTSLTETLEVLARLSEAELDDISKVDPKVKTRKPKFKVLFTPCLFNISLIR
jgi:hypothetical protein